MRFSKIQAFYQMKMLIDFMKEMDWKSIVLNLNNIYNRKLKRVNGGIKNGRFKCTTEAGLSK